MHKFLNITPAQHIWSFNGSNLVTRLPRDRKLTLPLKLAAFDLNDTLIGTKSGAPSYLTSAEDWRPKFESVKTVLKRLSDEGYTLVIFTNQNQIKGAGYDGKQVSKFKDYVDAFISSTIEGIPIYLLASTQKDNFRKPMTDMFDYFVEMCLNQQEWNREASFFCGDAAGRPTDFSDSDINFAKNVGIPFKLPEEVFQDWLPPTTEAN